jgi:protein SCO1/2
MKPRARLHGTPVIVAMLLAALLAAGCGRKAGAESAAEATPKPEGWELRGQIVAVNKDRGTLTVHHEDIPNFMPAMVMEFKVSPGDLATAKPNAYIRGWLYRSGDDWVLEKIWPDDDAARRTVEAATEALKQDTAIRGPYPYREVGEQAPDFALYDQDGRVVQASRFLGRRIVLNFIFTRCPDPKMCPASTAKMMALQEGAKEEGITGIEFISVSLDPKYDTPGILRQYADDHGIDTTNFSFLTGPQIAVTNLMAQLGVVAIEKDGLITHSLATLLIDGNGKIIHREDGTQWPVEQFMARLRQQ